ncbi:MAG: MATE family efflux transporter [Comamonadaceae bacterium]|nr:MAG: MATE family efflux transporter [Comamonadaceae bacterium]
MTTAAIARLGATQRMLGGPVLPTLLRLATPNVVGLFAATIVIGFDGYIVGRLGADALAGIALVLPLAMLMLQMSAGGLGGSASAVVARALGAGETARATQLARHAVLVGLAASLLFTAVGSSTAPYVAMGARDGVLDQAMRYAGVLFPGAAAIWSVNVLAGIARGTGQMGAAGLALVATTAMHLVLCPLLVFGAGPVPPLGIAGAATSTVFSNAMSALGLLAWLSRRGQPVRIVGPGWQLQKQAFHAVLRLALPSSGSSILTNTSIALATAYVGTFGNVVLAAYGIAARLEYILVPIAFGFGGALTTMVATNLGAQQANRAKRVTWTGAVLVLATTGLIGVAAALWPQGWMALFTADDAVQAAGRGYLRIVGGRTASSGSGSRCSSPRKAPAAWHGRCWPAAPAWPSSRSAAGSPSTWPAAGPRPSTR